MSSMRCRGGEGAEVDADVAMMCGVCLWLFLVRFVEMGYARRDAMETSHLPATGEFVSGRNQKFWRKTRTWPAVERDKCNFVK